MGVLVTSLWLAIGGGVLYRPQMAAPLSRSALRARDGLVLVHWFRHQAGVNCIPVLTCQLHQGLIAHGEHLTSPCQGWTDEMVRQRGWAPEVA